MDEDIDAIIDIARHYKYRENPGVAPFNRLSALPDTKRHMKMAIEERMRALVGAYISLASFIDDDLVDFLESDDSSFDKEKVKKIYTNVIDEMDQLRKEIEEFKTVDSPEDMQV